MAAIYPTGIRTFPTYANGDQVVPATINDPNLEITAIETGLRQGLAHDVVPDLTANNRNLGTSGQQWHDLHLSGSMTVAGGITGTITLDNLVVTGTVVISSGSLFVNGPILGVEYLALRGNRAAGQAVLTVENDDPAGLAALFRATTGAGIIVQLQDIAQVPRFDLHADGSMNTSGNLTIAGNATIGGTLTITGGQTFTTLTIGTLTVTGGVTVTGGITAGGAVITGVLDVRTSLQSYLQPGILAGTTATIILTTTRPHPNADVGGLVLVCGTKDFDVTTQFLDVLVVMTDGSVTVLNQHNKGAADGRTYTWSGLNLRITMVTTNYRIMAFPILVGASAF